MEGDGREAKKRRLDDESNAADDEAFWFAAAQQVPDPAPEVRRAPSPDAGDPTLPSPVHARPSGPPALFCGGPPPRIPPPSIGNAAAAPSAASSPRAPPALFFGAPRTGPPPGCARPLASAAAAAPSSSPSSLPASAPSCGARHASSGAREGHEKAHEDVFCNCQGGGTRKTFTGVVRNGGDNAGRRYYKCTQFKQIGGCTFWLWQEDYEKYKSGSHGKTRDPRAPLCRSIMPHDHYYATGGRTVERAVRMVRPPPPATTDAASSSTGPKGENDKDDGDDADRTAEAFVEAVTARWGVTRPAATDPTESDAEGAARLIPLVDIDRPLGETASEQCHPHVARTTACVALLAHMFAARGWHVAIQPVSVVHCLHVHLFVSQGPYDETSYWVRVEPAQRLDPRAPPSAPVQHDALWVQLSPPAPDATGWLAGSHVDIVAFEHDDGFLLVDRRRLWKYVDRFVVGRVSAEARASAASAGATSSSSPSPSSITEARSAIASLPAVSDPLAADHRILDMGAVGESPHERRTLIAVETLLQHDAAAASDDDKVVKDKWPFDPRYALPYLQRMGRRVAPPSPPPSTDPRVASDEPL